MSRAVRTRRAFRMWCACGGCAHTPLTVRGVPTSAAPRAWLQGVRLYDTALNSLRYYYTHKAPVLDAAFVDDSHVISGGLAQTVWM